ncbi:MAG: heme lyase CcmF/NrfE family subunit [Gammaproteobacteria bacterium]|nr:heme lyase CcmF/NrfE family subunit [Gammaproteobacteria bacterium]
MIPELGHFALFLALALALAQTVFPLIGAVRGIPNWMAVARPAAAGQSVFLILAFACLTYSFLNNDFSVLYVARHSNTALPVIYQVSAVWGGHEGSLLLWSLLLALWTVAVAAFSRSLSQAMAVRVIAVMGFVSIGFLLFMILTSNPFERVFPAPADGQDLNPLLQDFGLILHPPLLYMGYVGFSVAFAFAIAALLSGKLDSAWARWSRPWTLMAWMFLTLGIVLGSWWAYYELGWGGWWFWDPVENASFMPWLVGTGLLHSLAVTEKRGAFKNWTVLLAIIAFSLSLLGTFLVRSGVLTSVHAFATDPARGVFILIFLGVVVGASFLLYAWRAPDIPKGGSFELLSRETFLMLNNLLLVVAGAFVLLGTLYPLFLDALGMGKISVGPPYFSTMFLYIMIPLIAILGVGPLARWRKYEKKDLFEDTRVSLVLSLAAGGIVSMWLVNKGGLMLFLGIAGAVWVTLAALKGIHNRLAHKTELLRALVNFPAAFYAMVIAHLGMAVFIVGVVVSNMYSVEKDVRMAPDVPLSAGGHEFVLETVNKVEGPNYTAHQGLVRVYKDEQEVAVLKPQKRVYHVRRMPMTEAAIDPGFTRDLYVALGEPLQQGAWSMRVYYKPFIRWIWLGGLMMAFGGLLAAADKRYRGFVKAVPVKKMATQRVGAT